MERITQREMWGWQDFGPKNAPFGFYVGNGGQCANPRCGCNTAGQSHGPLTPHFEE